jgi:hypothetical protein
VGAAGHYREEEIRDWLSAPFAAFIYDYSVTDIQVRLAEMGAVEIGNSAKLSYRVTIRP